MKESDIIHETKNLYLSKVPLSNGRTNYAIWLNGATHAVKVGERNTIKDAKQTMDRLEAYPENLRRFHNHY